MEEENQQQVKQVMGEQQRVTTKDPKKVEAGKRLAAINRKKREARKREEQVQLEKIGVNQYYGFGAILALGVIGSLGYYIYRSKKGQVSQEVPNRTLQAPAPPQQPHPQTNKFEMN